MVPANNRLGSYYSDKIANPDNGNMVPLGLPLLQDGHALVPRLFDFEVAQLLQPLLVLHIFL